MVWSMDLLVGGGFTFLYFIIVYGLAADLATWPCFSSFHYFRKL
jgi:hypothetical protein